MTPADEGIRAAQMDAWRYCVAFTKRNGEVEVYGPYEDEGQCVEIAAEIENSLSYVPTDDTVQVVRMKAFHDHGVPASECGEVATA